jgi:signal transduction histidine kinase
VLKADNLERYAERMSATQRVASLTVIREQAEQLTTMLDDILTVMRAQGGYLTFNPVPLDIVAFCAGIIEEQRGLGGGVRPYTFNPCVENPTRWLDAKLLHLILGNLLRNASKYSPSGTPVTLDVWTDGDRVGLRVSDEGIGIPAADRSHLFEPFFRAGNTQNIQGTGLGLKIVCDCVRLHGGTIQVESEEGRGSAFTVILPAPRQTESGSPSAP